MTERPIRPLESPAIPGTSIHVVPGAGRSIIIDSPSLVTTPPRLALAGVTLGFWSVWMFFWRPVIIVASRLPGLEGLSGALVPGTGFQSFLQVLPAYLLVVVIMGGLLIGWANVNLLRFSGKDRRSARPPVTAEAMAAHFGVGAHQIAAHSRSNRICISYDSSGRIEGIQSADETSRRLERF